MSESDRVQRWRQRQREAGKEPLTIWLTTAEKLHLEDMALRRRCSPSELVQHMLAQWHGETQAVTDTITDTEQLRTLVQQELSKAQNVTATVTDTVIATLRQLLPDLLRFIMQEQRGEVTAAPPVTDTVTETVVVPMTYPVTVTVTETVVVPMTATVTDNATDASPVLRADHILEPAPEHVADIVSDTLTDTDRAPRANHKAPSQQRAVTDTVSDDVIVPEVKHRGRRPVLRPGILALLDEHPEGLTAAELKVYLGTEKPIGDTLAGMVRAQLLMKNGTGPGLRYQRADAALAPSRP